MRRGAKCADSDLPIPWGCAAISDPPRYAVVMAEQRNLLLVDLETAAAEVIFTGFVMEMIADFGGRCLGGDDIGSTGLGLCDA